MLSWWQTLVIGVGIAGVTAVLTALFSRLNEKAKWERERQERLEQWEREERQRERANRVQVYARFTTLATRMRREPIFPERADDFIEQVALRDTIRLTATAPVRDAAGNLWEALHGYGMSHDPIDGAYRNTVDTGLFERLRDAERLFLIAARKELGIHQVGDMEEYGGIPIA